MNYSLHYIFSGAIPEFVGFANFIDVMRDVKFQEALGRQMIFSVAILAVEIPLGIAIALSMPKKGCGVAVSLVLLGIPLAYSLQCCGE